MYKSITVATLAAVFAFAAFPGYADGMHGTDGMQKDMEHEAASQGHQVRGMVSRCRESQYQP